MIYIKVISFTQVNLNHYFEVINGNAIFKKIKTNMKSLFLSLVIQFLHIF